MSAPNFYTMKNFPLFVHDDFVEEVKRCRECGEIIYDVEDLEDGKTCPCCGSDDLEDDWFYDDFACDDFCREINQRLDEINTGLRFHRMELRSGYYSGVQLYVDTIHDLERYDYTNEDCRYEFDLCRSEAHRRFHSEQNKINRIMRKLAEEFGLEEYYCAGIFSTGEAIYYKAQDTQASRVRRAATEIR